MDDSLERMRLDEITKDVFHRKLADPAAQELHDIAESLRKLDYSHDADITVEFPVKEFATISVKIVPDTKMWNITGTAQNMVNKSDHWVWDTWEEIAGKNRRDYTIAMYVIRKT